MATRDETLPEDFFLHLAESIPGFKLEDRKHQFALGKMIWTGHCKKRQHEHFTGAMSFSYRELERAFGRGEFVALNNRLGIFRMSNNWSRDCAWTKGYWFTAAVIVARRQYFDRRHVAGTKLLLPNGATLKTIPAAVAAKDMAGMTTTAWSSAKKLNRIEVNLDALLELQNRLREIHLATTSGNTSFVEVIAPPNVLAIERLLDSTAQIIRLATTEVAGHGFIAQRYVQSKSGRLYAVGINLQSAPSPVKEAALLGMWEYDFSNCHYSILAQMAAHCGLECTFVREYLANKKGTRQAIASTAGISVDQAKTCLIAIMYGARASTWHENAIPQAVGPKAAGLLYQVPEFKGLQRDITAARTAILGKWRRTANGRLTNAFGKAISGREPVERQLAHLLQGVEAKALQAAVNLYPDDIVLLQHDGFSATSRLDMEAIQASVFSATGYHLQLEEKRISVHLDDYVQKHIQRPESFLPLVEDQMKSRDSAVFVQVNSALTSGLGLAVDSGHSCCETMLAQQVPAGGIHASI